MQKKIAVIMATTAGFNPGMLLTELMARSFIERHNLASCTTYYQFIPLKDRLLQLLSPDDVTEILTRTNLDIPYRQLESTDQLRQYDLLLYWGDFLHMYQYIDTVAALIPSKEAGISMQLLLLENANDLVSRVVSFGTTLIFNTGSHLISQKYGSLLHRFVEDAKLIMPRDMVSASQLALTSPDRQHPLGLDATQLVTTLDHWQAIFPHKTDKPIFRKKLLCFFGRATHDQEMLLKILKTLSAKLGRKCRWLPWGDDIFGFASYPELQSEFTSKKLFKSKKTTLSAIFETVAQSYLVITDTYHLAVTAWSLGVPALMILGNEIVTVKKHVNVGNFYGHVDKRFVFYAQHQLLEFLIDPIRIKETESLYLRLDRVIEHVEDGKLVAWHLEKVKERAQWCEKQLAKTLTPSPA